MKEENLDIEALLVLLQKTKDEYTRWEVVERLGRIGSDNPQVVEALLELLKTTKYEYTRREVVESLERIGSDNPQVVKALLELLKTTKYEFTRWEVVESLGRIGSDNPQVVEALLELLKTTEDESTRWKIVGSLGRIGSGNPQVVEGLLTTFIKTKYFSLQKDIGKFFKRNAIGNPLVIEKLRQFLLTTESVYTRRYLISPILKEIDSLTKQQSQQAEDDLLLFLEVTRIKETVDNYFLQNNRKKTRFCYQRIIACLDRMQEGRDILSRRSLMKSYLEIYQRIVTFTIKTKDFHSAFFYTELFRNRYLIERISQQHRPLPKTVSPQLSAQIEQARKAERKTLQQYTNAISKKLNEQQLERLEQQWQEAKTNLEQLYTQVATIEPEFIAKTKITPLSFKQVQDLLPSDTAIIEFFFTHNKLVTILILPQEQSPIIPEELSIKISKNDLGKLAHNWLDMLEPKKDKSSKSKELETEIEKILTAIYDTLELNKIINYIPQNIKHLTIIPHNYLHLFPLHALLTNNHQHLIEKFTLSYFPSLQIWKICQNRQRNHSSLLCIENPSEDKDLIFAKAEVASISQSSLFSQVQILDSKQQSQTSIKAEILNSAQNHNVFHFSGHGEYNLVNPLDSYLMLSQKKAENLTLNTIFTELNLPKVDLVTLSACCTGVVDALQPTEEYLGL